MAPQRRVTTEEAAVVFRRAVELDAIARRAGNDSLLDLEALEEVGEEVGLSPESIQQALEELGGEAFQEPVRSLGVTASRIVQSTRGRVLFAVNELAERHLLTLRTRARATWAWNRVGGVKPAARRVLLGRRRNPLLALRELQATITSLPSEPGFVRVRLDAAVAALSIPAGTVAMAGFGASVAGLAWAFQGAGDLAVGTISGIGAAGFSGAALHKYRDSVTAVEESLGAFLDRLTFSA